MKITLCKKVLDGDIEENKFTDKDDIVEFINEFLRTKDFSKSVFVCFLTHEVPVQEMRNAQNAFLITHIEDEIDDMVESLFQYQNWNDLDFSVFEFENYQEAFKYCSDLKESF